MIKRQPKLSTHGNGEDCITPLAAILKEIARTHNEQALRTDPGSERAALHVNIKLASRGWALTRL
jgi:hypothetical protein